MKPVDRLLALLLAGVFALLRALGPAGASNLAGWLARGIGPWLPVARVADANLRLAMPELIPSERRRIVRGVFDNLGRVVGELPHLAALRRTASGPGWEIEGEDIVRALAEAGGPAIFVTGHVGNWEMLPPVASGLGVRLAIMYRAANNRAVDAVVNELRHQGAGGHMELFAKGAAGARDALRHLAKGGYLGLLVDQKMNDGIPAPFFGHLAMTAPAPAALALRFRCPVYPVHVRRLGPARFRMICEPALALPDTGDRRADIAALTHAINERLEGWVRAAPESWFWLHRRWPKR